MRLFSNWFPSFRELFAAPPHFRRVEVAAEWPDTWHPATVFVQGEDGQEWAAAFICPCGCRDIVYLNLLPTTRPRWKLRRGRHGYPTISPSVARKVKCGAHFIVSEGRIISCRWRDEGECNLPVDEG